MNKYGELFNRIENIKYKNYLFTTIEYNDMFEKCFGIKLDESIIYSVIERIITKMDDWIRIENKKSSEIEINPRELFKDLINKFYRGFYYIKLEDNHLELYMKTGYGKIPFSLNLRILNIYPTDIAFDKENYIEIVKNY